MLQNSLQEISNKALDMTNEIILYNVSIGYPSPSIWV